MTRTQYTNLLRKAEFSVQPVWQAATEHGAGKDVTCYAVYAADGAYLTQMIVSQRSREPDGLDVFFASPGPTVGDDIAHLRRTIGEAA